MTTKKPPKPLVGRKLLVAALGVATVNYVAVTGCGGKEEQSSSGFPSSSSGSSGNPPTSGNLPGPDPDAMVPPTSGNLPAPEAGFDAGDGGDADAADADDDGG